MSIGDGPPFNMGYIVMRKPKNRQNASSLLSMGHKDYEANRWNPCAYDEIKVIMSPQLGVKQVRILSHKEALKLAAKQRLDSWGYNNEDVGFKGRLLHLGVFTNRGRFKAAGMTMATRPL